MLEDAGARIAEADHQIVLAVEGQALAYLHWHDDGERFLAEFVDPRPGEAEPLVYHQDAGLDAGRKKLALHVCSALGVDIGTATCIMSDALAENPGFIIGGDEFIARCRELQERYVR